MTRLRRTLLALGLLGLLAAPTASAPAADSYLTGQLLVASEGMRDPRFAESVIYMVRHDAQGAMGLIVNHPLQALRYRDLLQRLGQDAAGVDGEVMAYFGGPVELDQALVLHSPDVVVETTTVVDDEVAVTGGKDILERMAHGEGPTHGLLILGYSGWAPGQLEAEMARGDWFTIPSDAGLVFAEEPAKTWSRAMLRSGVDL